jgi:hypothetical protein
MYWGRTGTGLGAAGLVVGVVGCVLAVYAVYKVNGR